MSDKEAVVVLRETIGKSVKRWRVTAGISQQRLADKIGVSRNTVSNIERGKHHADATTLVLIASALGASVFDLAKGKEPPKIHECYTDFGCC